MRSRAVTRTYTLFEESSLHRVAGEPECNPKVFARDLVSPAPQLKLAERRMIERITGEAVRVSDRANLFKSARWTLVLRHRDGAVERDNW